MDLSQWEITQSGSHRPTDNPDRIVPDCNPLLEVWIQQALQQEDVDLRGVRMRFSPTDFDLLLNHFPAGFLRQRCQLTSEQFFLRRDAFRALASGHVVKRSAPSPVTPPSRPPQPLARLVPVVKHPAPSPVTPPSRPPAIAQPAASSGIANAKGTAFWVQQMLDAVTRPLAVLNAHGAAQDGADSCLRTFLCTIRQAVALGSQLLQSESASGKKRFFVDLVLEFIPLTGEPSTADASLFLPPLPEFIPLTGEPSTADASLFLPPLPDNPIMISQFLD